MMRSLLHLSWLVVVAASPVTAYARACQAPAADASRIAVAGGSITEIIYELGMEDRLVAVDRTSNYPVAATGLPSLGYVRAVSAEGLLALNPTLVLGEHDTGPPEVLAQMAAAGLPLVIVPEVHTIEGIFAKVDCVAQVIDAPDEAVDRLKARMNTQVARLATLGRTDVRAAILLNLTEGVPLGGGADTSAEGVLAMAGASNVFAAFQGWKPISLESMVQMNPDVLVMPTRGIASAGGRQAVLANPSVKLTQAGRHGHLIDVDGMSLLGFGPRTLSTAVTLAESFSDLGGQ